MRCVICDSPSNSPLYADINVVKCKCDHVYYTGDLDDKKIQDLYSEKYFLGEEYVNYVDDKEIIQKNFQSRLCNVLEYVKSGKLLEIGSAYGFFLDLAKYKFETLGFEISPEAVDYAKNQLGLNVKNEDFLNYPLEKLDSFDAVCLYDCIEHLLHPENFIEKIAKVTKKGGHIFVTTGDIDTLVPKLRGKKWRLMHPPTHIHYFSRKSLSALLEKNGFRVLKVNYPGYWRSISQAIAGITGSMSLAKKVPGNFYLNTFDIMEIIAKKI